MQAYTQDDYTEVLKKLLPRGKVWTRENTSNLAKLLKVFAKGMVEVDEKALEAVDETIPSTTIELLQDWERVTGFPDACTGVLEQTILERRNAVVSKLRGIGNLTKSFLIGIAANLGFTVTIDEFWDFQVGRSTVGQALTNGPWRYTFQVNEATTGIRTFKVDTATVGQKLVEYDNIALQCIIVARKPAHTIVVYNIMDEGGTR